MLNSTPRQFALGLLGLVFIAMSFSGPADTETSTPAAAAVTAAGVDCDRLEPLTSERKSLVTFTNYSARTVALYWLNYDGDGAARFYFNLAPKEHQTLETFVSHSWCIRDASNGVPVQAITIKSEEQDVSIQ